jgi:glutamyl-tRNA synthetase
MSKPVRTRIAPSPTGDPHVGTAYIGLVNMVHARQHGGKFVFRLDDTDRSRYRADSEATLFRSLRWLGLEWDEGPDKGGPYGPYRQSERTEIYREHVDRLLASGHAYRCFCTPEEIEAHRAQLRAEKKTPRAPRTWRDADPAAVAEQLAAGAPHVVRLKVPLEEDVTITDLLRKDPITINTRELQDQVLLKADGFPTYHLASVVDDALFEISHIVRAEEWISSAPIHKLLFDALAYPMPVLCHMPLLRNADKSKISKRKNPTSLLHYKEAGFLPEGLLNFLALLGWGGPRTPDGGNQEIFSLDEMVEHFRLDKVSLGSPVFDQAKLRHVNAEHLRALTPEEFVRVTKDYMFEEERMLALAPLLAPRVETLGEVCGRADFVFGEISHYTPETRKLKDKNLRLVVPGLQPEGVEALDAHFALREVREALEGLTEWTPEELETTCRSLSGEDWIGWKAKTLLMAIRVAIAGKRETPPLFETMAILGKSRVVGRIDQAARALAEPGKKALKRWEKSKAERAARRAATPVAEV